ncbi:hypothetical protein [Saccharopolyspora thermophila]|nr:hypothetical protein [Saccharopolyspora subtropica]
MSARETVALVLAQAPTPPPGDPGGQGEDFGKSSPVGLLLLVVFGIAVVFLVRSMTKHLKKVPVVFDAEKAAAAAPARAKRAEAAKSEEPAAEDEAKPDEGKAP